MRTIKPSRKKLKKTPQDEKASYIHGLAELISRKCRFNIVSIKIPMSFFSETEK
jgi:hypothetical protein